MGAKRKKKRVRKTRKSGPRIYININKFGMGNMNEEET